MAAVGDGCGLMFECIFLVQVFSSVSGVYIFFILNRNYLILGLLLLIYIYIYINSLGFGLTMEFTWRVPPKHKTNQWSYLIPILNFMPSVSYGWS
jgi:hypothetical protein